MLANSDAAVNSATKPAAKISLVEAACARFESAQPAAASAQKAPAGNAANPFKQRARERLRLLQGSGLGAAGDSNETKSLPAKAPASAARAQPAQPSALRIHAMWATLCLVLAAAWVAQWNQNAVSAPVKSMAAVAPTLPLTIAPNVSPRSADEPLTLQLEKSLHSQLRPRP